MALSAASRRLLGHGSQAERFGLSRQLFLSLLCIVYFAAFVSFGIQAEGLIGADGILPAGALLGRVDAQLGAEKYWQLPTLLWLGSSDAAIRGLWMAGALGSVLPIVGVAPRLALFALWGLYLSLVSVGGIFFGYQWDALLLEAGLTSLFFAPAGWLPSQTRHAPVSKPGLWLLRWLLFRLMLLSGLVKLLGGDETWTEGTALAFHYFTQPLPTWTSYYAHQLPALLHSFASAATLAIEIGAPFLIFGPRRVRAVGFVLLAGLQLAIAATGNYGFFNLLSFSLCVPLLGDEALLKAAPKPLRARLRRRFSESPEASPRSALRGALPWLAAALLFVLSTGAAFDRVGFAVPRPSWFESAQRTVAPLRSINSYGLFAVMTTSRPEILLEGSYDGREWRTYEFHWKAGRLDRRPEFAGLHLPRLDWQLWFAALRGCERAPWFHQLLERTLQGSPSLSGLLRVDPFPGLPPRYLRSSLFAYEFDTSGGENWWRRRYLQPYCATVMAGGDGLQRADLPPRADPE